MKKRIYRVDITNKNVSDKISSLFGGVIEYLADYEKEGKKHTKLELSKIEQLINEFLLKKGIIQSIEKLGLVSLWEGQMYCTDCEDWYHVDDGCYC